MKKFRQIFILFIATLLSLSLVSENVQAAITISNITCTNGKAGANDTFLPLSFVSNPAAFGPPNPLEPCGLVDSKHFFSGLACHFVNSMNKVFPQFYCAIQFGMKETIIAVMALFLIVFGAKVLMGMEQLSPGRVILAMVKIGAIFMIVDWAGAAVIVIYGLFAGLIIDSVDWVITAIYSSCTAALGFVTTSCMALASNSPTTNFSTIFEKADDAIYAAINGFNSGGTTIGGIFSENAEFIAFIMVLLVICPPLYFIILTTLFTALKVFVQAIVSVLLCLIVIAFLICLSPIFICFMLFGSTYKMFDSWLKFLISYSIQPALIFAIFGLWLFSVIDFVQFTGQLSKVMAIQDTSILKGSVNKVGKDELVFCKMNYSDKKTTLGFSLTTIPTSASTAALLAGINFGGPSVNCCQLLGSNNVPLGGFTTCTSNNVADINAIVGANRVLPQRVIPESGFIYFIAYHFITLAVISYAFFSMINIVPELAQEMASAHAPLPLGAGFSGGGGLRTLIDKGTSAVIGTSSRRSKMVDAAKKADYTSGSTYEAGKTTASGLAGRRSKPS